jgi:hypothetical protein
MSEDKKDICECGNGDDCCGKEKCDGQCEKNNKKPAFEKPTVFIGGDSGDIIFFNKVELLRICEDGKIFIQENEFLANTDFYAAMKEFFYNE